MTSAVRYSYGYARMRALKARLWTPIDRPMLLRAGIDPDGHAVSGEPSNVFPPLVAWYVTLLRAYPSASRLLLGMLRLHEIENLKLLWRAALRARPLEAGCWRPLEPLATLRPDLASESPQDLVHRLSKTPYEAIARALLRSHATDLPAMEIGLDRWALTALRDAADALPSSEDAARRIVFAIVRERDVELLSRGTGFGLDADLVAKSTVLLSRERRLDQVKAAAAWEDVLVTMRRSRLRACRRAFVGWPFQLAPAVAALLLREEQARAAQSIAAAREGGRAAEAALPVALAAAALEA